MLECCRMGGNTFGEQSIYSRLSGTLNVHLRHLLHSTRSLYGMDQPGPPRNSGIAVQFRQAFRIGAFHQCPARGIAQSSDAEPTLKQFLHEDELIWLRSINATNNIIQLTNNHRILGVVIEYRKSLKNLLSDQDLKNC